MTNFTITHPEATRIYGVFDDSGTWKQAVSSNPTHVALLNEIPTSPGIYEGVFITETYGVEETGVVVDITWTPTEEHESCILTFDSDTGTTEEIHGTGEILPDYEKQLQGPDNLNFGFALIGETNQRAGEIIENIGTKRVEIFGWGTDNVNFSSDIPHIELQPKPPSNSILYFDEDGAVQDEQGSFYLSDQGYGEAGTTNSESYLTISLSLPGEVELLNPEEDDEIRLDTQFAILGTGENVDTVDLFLGKSGYEVQIASEIPLVADSFQFLTAEFSSSNFSQGDDVYVKAVSNIAGIEAIVNCKIKTIQPGIHILMPREGEDIYVGLDVPLIVDVLDIVGSTVKIIGSVNSSVVFEIEDVPIVNDQVETFIFFDSIVDDDAVTIRVEDSDDPTTFDEVNVTAREVEFYGRIYVDGSVAESGVGITWETAFKTLQEALIAQGSLPENSRPDIWIAGGLYRVTTNTANQTDSFQLNSNSRIYGGFAGYETSLDQRDISWIDFSGTGVYVKIFSHPTILTGDIDGSLKVHTVVRSAEGSYLEGCIISDGSSPSHAGGIVSSEVDCEFENIIVEGCDGQFGGGVYMTGISTGIRKKTTLKKSYIINNQSSLGGGLYCGGWSTPELIDCAVIDNVSSEDGGGIFMINVQAPAGEDTNLERCFISGNTAGYSGGGLYFSSGSSPIFSNSIIYENNSEEDGAGVFMNASDATFKNCTIAYNHANSYGGGIFMNDFVSCDLENVIVYHNTNGGSVIYSQVDFWQNNTSLRLTNTCYQVLDSGWINGGGNFTTNPALLGTAPYPLRLSSSSPCIDTGNNALVIGDLDNLRYPRIINDTVDIGALEYQDDSPNITFDEPENNADVPDIFKISGTASSEIFFVEIQANVSWGSGWETLSMDDISSLGGVWSGSLNIVDDLIYPPGTETPEEKKALWKDSTIQLRAVNSDGTVFSNEISVNLREFGIVVNEPVMLKPVSYTDPITFNASGTANTNMVGRKVIVEGQSNIFPWMWKEIGEFTINSSNEWSGTCIFSSFGAQPGNLVIQFKVEDIVYDVRVIYLFD